MSAFSEDVARNIREELAENLRTAAREFAARTPGTFRIVLEFDGFPSGASSTVAKTLRAIADDIAEGQE